MNIWDMLFLAAAVPLFIHGATRIIVGTIEFDRSALLWGTLHTGIAVFGILGIVLTPGGGGWWFGGRL